MVQRANQGLPLTDEELTNVVHSLQNIAPYDSHVSWDDIRQLLLEVAHLSHKDWTVTSANAQKLSKHFLAWHSQQEEERPMGEGMTTISRTGAGEAEGSLLSRHARQMYERIITEGNWDGAANWAAQALDQPGYHPWAVLVTGVNGIRKTTSMYQPWFPQVLSEALMVPTGKQPITDILWLPCGSNSFFRQLDHMIATLCNEDFTLLYSLTAQLMEAEGMARTSLDPPPKSIVQVYSDYKAAIFSRYRTLSELLGAILLQQAQRVGSNCMMETSGKDVAMFHYVDHFFSDHHEDRVDDKSSSSSSVAGGSGGGGGGAPRPVYHKLALHFTINDLSLAQESVDRRMITEIQNGIRALERQDIFDIIQANAGGPYGSEVLPGVQQASEHVWESEVLSGNVGQDWYKATIAIEAHPTLPWTACAVRPDGSLGTKFTFERNV